MSMSMYMKMKMKMKMEMKMKMKMKIIMMKMLMAALHYASWFARASIPMHLHALPVHALRQVCPPCETSSTSWNLMKIYGRLNKEMPC